MRIKVNLHDGHHERKNSIYLQSPVALNGYKITNNLGAEENNFLLRLERQNNFDFLSLIENLVINYSCIRKLYVINCLLIPAEDSIFFEILTFSFTLSGKNHKRRDNLVGDERVLQSKQLVGVPNYYV